MEECWEKRSAEYWTGGQQNVRKKVGRTFDRQQNIEQENCRILDRLQTIGRAVGI
jgi:hypothetical protein